MSRPISIGGVLIASVTALRARPFVHWRIGLILSFLPSLIVAASDYGWIPNTELIIHEWVFARFSNPDQGLYEDELRLVGGATLIASTVTRLLYGIPQVALLALVARAAMSLPIGRANVWKGALGWWKIYVIWLLGGLAALAGLLLMILPGIIIFLMFSTSVQVAATEPIGVSGSLNRSIKLTRGNRWRILAIILISTLIALVPIGLLSFIFYVLPINAAALSLGFVAIDGVFDFGIFPAVAAVIEVWLASIAAQTFIALKTIADGPDVETISDTFD